MRLSYRSIPLVSLLAVFLISGPVRGEEQKKQPPRPAITSIPYAINRLGVATERPAAADYLRGVLEDGSEDQSRRFTAGIALATRGEAPLRREYDRIIEIYKQILPFAKTQEEVSRVHMGTAHCHTLAKRYSDAIRVLKEFLDSSESYSAAKRTDFVVKLAGVYLANTQASHAISLLKQAITDFSGDVTPTKNLTMASLLVDACIEVGRREDAVQAFAVGLTTYARELPDYQVALYRKLGDMHAKQLNDVDAAKTVYRSAIEVGSGAKLSKMGSDCLVASYLALSDLYADSEREDENACRLLLSGLDSCAEYPTAPLMISAKLIDAGATHEQKEEALSLLWGSMAARTTSAAAIGAGACNQAVIRLLLSMPGKEIAALQEARAYFFWCPRTEIRMAIDLLVDAFKANDFHLGRANRFLRFQKFGMAGEDKELGTEDDLEDILLSIPQLDNDAREKPFKKALGSLPRDWRGYEMRSRFYLYLDHPVDAFEALQKSFSVAPSTQRELQAATDALTNFIIRCLKDTDAAEALVQFLMYGKDGKDGLKGTPDDIDDPRPSITQRLRYGAKKATAAADAGI